MDTQTLTRYQQKYERLFPELNERSRRLLVAADARLLGHGGTMFLHKASGLARSTIQTGLRELDEQPLPAGRIRRPGGGRKPLTAHQPDLAAMVERAANTKTDKRVLVRWTSHSIDHIVSAVRQRGFTLSRDTVWRILKDKGYALKANKKDIEGSKDHPDRDEQFRHINMMGLKMQLQGLPIMSIDAKKTEKIGNLKNNGREWTAPGEETKVDVYDFGQKERTNDGRTRLMKAIPYGVYDVINKQGFVNVGIDHNTAEFAVHSLHQWWYTTGTLEYPEATEILLFADSGSSNGSNNKLWKYCLQQFANRTRLTVHVCHYPPGTSKWNAIEHEMFSFININWRAVPLTAYEVVLEYIRHTTTKTGLTIEAVLDTNTYEIGKKVTDEMMKTIAIQGDEFHPEWNYCIRPTTT
ncbi:MAG TPA: ISAzo13 family transposase [Candidatus Bathyarchaeia archaeon]|nr:ISAzo13 family transposase [Candidatus Bathyarchaeia archaeon]